ncbi:uncharacterized protein LOC119735528 [Patiria miniata]|uniref:Uncharacterized protein n=1 Tax=Patiria miniata TaxID=46514 RepID=A0A914ANK4_PATMI|nr:uncharacterized protein LOC119735528 [Patiria miniata]
MMGRPWLEGLIVFLLVARLSVCSDTDNNRRLSPEENVNLKNRQAAVHGAISSQPSPREMSESEDKHQQARDMSSDKHHDNKRQGHPPKERDGHGAYLPAVDDILQIQYDGLLTGSAIPS